MGLKIKLNGVMVEQSGQGPEVLHRGAGVRERQGHRGRWPGYRWLTVISPEGHPDVELVLEPNAEPGGPARFREGLFKQGIPATAFEVGDASGRRGFRRLKAQGVVFHDGPHQDGRGHPRRSSPTPAAIIIRLERDC